MRAVKAKGLKSDYAAKSADFIRPVNLMIQRNNFFFGMLLKKNSGWVSLQIQPACNSDNQKPTNK